VEGKHTVALHDTQEFDDNFGRWADEDLALATAFGVDYVILYHTSAAIIHVRFMGGVTYEAVILVIKIK
jgi:hypothetical protein